MYHTIEITYFTKPVRLENNTIDNRSGRLKIPLKNVNFCVGYFNVNKRERILRQIMIRDRPPTESYQFIEPGLYNIKQVTDIIALSNTPWLEMNINENGEFTLVLKK